MFGLESSISRLVQFEKCEFTTVNDHFEGKHNEDSVLYGQILIIQYELIKNIDMKEKKVIIIVAVVMILGISVGGMTVLGNLKKETKKEAKEVAKRYVLAQPVEYSITNSNITASGRLESKDFFDLSAEVQGKILNGNVPLKKGQSFKRGQTIVKIYNKEFELSLKAHKSRFLNFVANLLPDFKVDYPDSYQNWKDFFSEIELDKDLPELPNIES